MVADLPSFILRSLIILFCPSPTSIPTSFFFSYLISSPSPPISFFSHSFSLLILLLLCYPSILPLQIIYLLPSLLISHVFLFLPLNPPSHPSLSLIPPPLPLSSLPSLPLSHPSLPLSLIPPSLSLIPPSLPPSSLYPIPSSFLRHPFPLTSILSLFPHSSPPPSLLH